MKGWSFNGVCAAGPRASRFWSWGGSVLLFSIKVLSQEVFLTVEFLVVTACDGLEKVYWALWAWV